MTNWRAVGWGFLTFLVVAVLGSAVPVVGQLGAGVLGGLVAGYLAGGGLWNGAVHGAIAGSLTGIAYALLFAFFGSLLGLAAGPLGGLLGGAGVFVLGLFVTLVFALDSAIAGAVGAAVSNRPAAGRSASTR